MTHWLSLCVITSTSDGAATGSSRQSLDAQLTLHVARPCSTNNCVGCSQLGTQQLCYALQQCQIANCIGTLVNLNRPLCAIGSTAASAMYQYVSTIEGAWLVISDTMVQVLDAAGGIQQPAAITWPDQAFYGFVCSAKDTSANAISIVMSSIGGLVQTANQFPAAQATMQAQSIDNKANAIFTMNLAAMTNFLYQLGLAPLYGLLALQKAYICEANSLMSAVNTTGLVARVGDASIQSASDNALGKCMTSYASENTQGSGTGVSSNTASIASQAIQTLQTLSLNLALDAVIHPMDATFTWLSGAVSGLQVIYFHFRSEFIPTDRVLFDRTSSSPPTQPSK